MLLTLLHEKKFEFFVHILSCLLIRLKIKFVQKWKSFDPYFHKIFGSSKKAEMGTKKKCQTPTSDHQG